MPQAKIVMDLVGGTDFSRAAPNIEGTALAVNCFTESNTEGDNKNVRTFLQSAPGVKYFDTEKFGCDFGYTMDGGAIGELEFENFNAASASIKIQGRNIHPGYAKNKMVNSQLIAMELNAMLPEFERPQYTQDYEGFFLLIHIEGCVENTQLNYIIRDHDREKFEGKKKLMQDIVNFLNLKYDNRLTCEIKDQYYNMREKVEPVWRQPLLQGTPLPQHLRRRPQLPRQIRICAVGVDGEGRRGYRQHRESALKQRLRGCHVVNAQDVGPVLQSHLGGGKRALQRVLGCGIQWFVNH